MKQILLELDIGSLSWRIQCSIMPELVLHVHWLTYTCTIDFPCVNAYALWACVNQNLVLKVPYY